MGGILAARAGRLGATLPCRMTLYGTEISFRLGPGTLEEARAVAGRLAAAAAGCRRHVLFVDADAGEYGCLAEWERREDAEGFAGRPATREEIRGVPDRAVPGLRLELERHDLSLENRRRTRNRAVVEAAQAVVARGFGL